MKKILALLLVLSMIFMVSLTACAPKDEEKENNEEGNNNNNGDDNKEEEGEKRTLVFEDDFSSNPLASEDWAVGTGNYTWHESDGNLEGSGFSYLVNQTVDQYLKNFVCQVDLFASSEVGTGAMAQMFVRFDNSSSIRLAFNVKTDEIRFAIYTEGVFNNVTAENFDLDPDIYKLDQWYTMRAVVRDREISMWIVPKGETIDETTAPQVTGALTSSSPLYGAVGILSDNKALFDNYKVWTIDDVEPVA